MVQINPLGEQKMLLAQPELPFGAIMQVAGALGTGKTEVVLKLLSKYPGLRIAWIEEMHDGRDRAYPCAFPQNGVELDRVLFVEAPKSRDSKSAIWAAHQILRSQLFKIVCLGLHRFDEIVLRRLQLAAEKTHAAVILLSQVLVKQGSWPIAVQLEVERDLQEGVLVKLIKSRKTFLQGGSNVSSSVYPVHRENLGSQDFRGLRGSLPSIESSGRDPA